MEPATTKLLISSIIVIIIIAVIITIYFIYKKISTTTPTPAPAENFEVDNIVIGKLIKKIKSTLDGTVQEFETLVKLSDFKDGKYDCSAIFSGNTSCLYKDFVAFELIDKVHTIYGVDVNGKTDKLRSGTINDLTADFAYLKILS